MLKKQLSSLSKRATTSVTGKTIHTVFVACYPPPPSLSLSKPMSLDNVPTLLRAEETMTAMSRGDIRAISPTCHPSWTRHSHHDESESAGGGSLEQKLQLIALHRMAALEHCARYLCELEASMELIGRDDRDGNNGCTLAAIPAGDRQPEREHTQQWQQWQQQQHLQQPEGTVDHSCRSRGSRAHSMLERRCLRKERRVARRQSHSQHMDRGTHCTEQSVHPSYLADLTYYNGVPSLQQQQRQLVAASPSGCGWRRTGGVSVTLTSSQARSSSTRLPALTEDMQGLHRRRNMSAEGRAGEWNKPWRGSAMEACEKAQKY